MIVSIHQPSYFPWLGLLNKIAKSDIYILLDEVQLTKRSYQYRNLILSPQGNIVWITIPREKGSNFKVIKDIKIAESNWGAKHLNIIKNYYGKHPYFEDIYLLLVDYYSKHRKYLIDAVVDSMILVFEILDIKANLILQSEISYNKSAKKGELMLELVKSVNGKVYISGTGAKEYMREVLPKFYAEGIRVYWNKFNHPSYPQKNSRVFIPGLSILDMLFNIGIEKAKKVFWENVNQETYLCD